MELILVPIDINFGETASAQTLNFLSGQITVEEQTRGCNYGFCSVHIQIQCGVVINRIMIDWPKGSYTQLLPSRS